LLGELVPTGEFAVSSEMKSAMPAIADSKSTAITGATTLDLLTLYEKP
jgi:hypothetical protein